MDIPSLNTSAAEGLSVAVIGCGPAGMFFLRQLELERSRLLERKEALEADGDHFEATQIQEKISILPRPTVFEKDSRCGGLWQSKSMVETDDTSWVPVFAALRLGCAFKGAVFSVCRGHQLQDPRG